MFWFVVGVIVAIAGLLCFVGAIFAPKNTSANYRPGLGIAGVACLLVFALLWFIGGLKSVPTKSIGIPLAFGKITGQPYGPGIHSTWEPWLHLADVSERVQTTTFEVNQKTGQGGLDVRIGGQQTAQLDVTIQWQIPDSAADGLFLDYGQGANIMGDVQNAVVVRELKVVANQIMGDYNPIQDVSANTTAGNSQFSHFGPAIQRAMIHDIGRRIHVLTVLIPLAHYDATTQARLNSIQQQYAKTAIADQQYKTNLAQARANDALSRSVARDPNVILAQCMQIVQEAISADYQGLPATFCSFGGGSGVVVPARR